MDLYSKPGASAHPTPRPIRKEQPTLKKGKKPQPRTAPRLAEGRRIAFRKYITRSGIMGTLTKILLGIYELNDGDKPVDALEYLFDRLGSGMPIRIQMKQLEQEKLLLEEKVRELDTQNEQLMEQLIFFEPIVEEEDEEEDDDGLETEEGDEDEEEADDEDEEEDEDENDEQVSELDED